MAAGADIEDEHGEVTWAEKQTKIHRKLHIFAGFTVEKRMNSGHIFRNIFAIFIALGLLTFGQTSRAEADVEAAERIKKELNFHLSLHFPNSLDSILNDYGQCKLAPFWSKNHGGSYQRTTTEVAAASCASERESATRLANAELAKNGVADQADRSAIIHNCLLLIDLQADFMANWTAGRQ